MGRARGWGSSSAMRGGGGAGEGIGLRQLRPLGAAAVLGGVGFGAGDGMRLQQPNSQACGRFDAGPSRPPWGGLAPKLLSPSSPSLAHRPPPPLQARTKLSAAQPASPSKQAALVSLERGKQAAQAVEQTEEELADELQEEEADEVCSLGGEGWRGACVLLHDAGWRAARITR